MAKQYGLITNKKSLHPMGSVGPSVFENNSDSDSDSAKPTGLKTALKRQDKLIREKAVEEDPTVFQYDELYDEMDSKRKESKLSRKDLDKKPKYIGKLLESADRRKREYERRIERQVQREREAEGEEYKDKESFVTSAYRTKLEEMRKLDEQEEREEYLESIGDVKKQGNLDGFYRHLYDQKVLSEDKEEKQQVNKEPVNSKKRKYRKHDSDSEEEEEAKQIDSERKTTLQHLPSNIDADSDFSIDSSDSEKETAKVKVEASTSETKEVKDDQPIVDSVKVEEVEEVLPLQKVAVKPKINIWKKRTVGIMFDEALRRYYERKAAKEAGTYVRPCL